MESPTKALLPYNTALTDRTLWFDGDSTFDAGSLLKLKSHYRVQFVNDMTELVREYNRNVPRDKELKVKDQCREVSADWTIPKAFRQLDVVGFLTQAHYELMGDCDQKEFDKRERRLAQELVKYDQLGLYDVLRAIIWIINKLTTAGIVWGVGRGSSVSSYVLYIVGVHDVDSFAYELNVDDFLHE